MALERVRGKRSARGRNRLRFLKRVAQVGKVLFVGPSGDPFKKAKLVGLAGVGILDAAADVAEKINIELANTGIDLSRKMIAFSDLITDLAQEVSPLDKRAERVLDGILDFPTEAFFRAWIFTLETYLESIEDAEARREQRMKTEPKKPLPPGPKAPPGPGTDRPSRQPIPREL